MKLFGKIISKKKTVNNEDKDQYPSIKTDEVCLTSSSHTRSEKDNANSSSIKSSHTIK